MIDVNNMAKYNNDIKNDMVEWVRENGLIDHGGARFGDFCNHFGIDDMTFYRWMERSEFSEAIKKAKEYFRGKLEVDIVKSLANSAKGYEYTQTVTEYKSNDKGKPVIVKQVKKNIHVEPNVGAAIFLLTNIAPERWRNRRDVSYTEKDIEEAIKQNNEPTKVIFEDYSNKE